MLPGLQPTVFMMCNAMIVPFSSPARSRRRLRHGRRISAGRRRIKSTSPFGAVFSRQISFDAGALETVILQATF
jgi:D-alanine transaminase